MANRYLEDPDVVLMLQVRDGNEVAFEKLVNSYSPTLVKYMTKFLGSRALAEDLAQEAFLKVYRAAENYEPKARFRTWLLTIGTNLCLNQKRWEQKHFHHSLDALKSEDGRSFAMDLEDEGPAPSADAEQFELEVAVKQAILALPGQQRAAVALARYEQLSYQEISEALGLSVMAVKSLLNRAKEGLRAHLTHQLPDHPQVTSHLGKTEN